MTPGPEMDAHVAVRVMELVRAPGNDPSLDGNGVWLPKSNLPCTAATEHYRHSYGINLPPYSTDIAAAWLVVEKVTAEWWLEINQPSLGCWRVMLTKHGHEAQGTFDYEAASGSFPEAICRAALAAVGVALE